MAEESNILQEWAATATPIEPVSTQASPEPIANNTNEPINYSSEQIEEQYENTQEFDENQVLSYLRDRMELGDDYQSLDDIKIAYQNAVSLLEQKEEFERKAKEMPIGITPEDMRILELHKKGELQDALVIKNTDFTKLDEKEVLRFKFNQENKGMPQKIRDRQFEKMYDAKYSESVDDTDDDIEEKKYYLKTDAENARLDLEKKQNELFKVEANSYKTKAQQEQEQLALQNGWIKSVDETLDFIGKTVTIGEGDEAYNYILEQEQQEELKSFMTDPITFIANLTKDSKGEINKQELAKIGIRMLFGDDIHEKRTPFLVQKGKLDKIIEYRNPSPSINTGARSAANTDPHMNSILEWAKTAR